MILEGLESFKRKDVGSEIMSMMFEGLLKLKPTDPQEAHENWEKHQKTTRRTDYARATEKTIEK